MIDKEKKISSLKRGGDNIVPREGRRAFRETNPISKKDPPLGKGKQIELRLFSSPSSLVFFFLLT